MRMDAKKFQVEVLASTEANVLFLSGELDLGTVNEFRMAVEPLAANHSVPLKVNLRELSYIDSTGIGIFVAVLKIRKEKGGALIIQDVPAKIKRLFDMTGLSKFLTIESEAV
ncbi:anti-anti-sigma factor [Paenibacillus sp. PvR052]